MENSDPIVDDARRNSAGLPLFRTEVIERSRAVDGDVGLGRPLSENLFFGFLGVVALAAGLFICTFKVSASETVSGEIIPNGGLISVKPPNPGVVTSLTVEEGQDVRAGQTLARIDASPTIAAGNVGSLISATIQDEVTAGKRRIEASRAQQQVEVEGLRRQRVLLLSQRQDAERSLDLAAQQRRLAEDALDRARGLADQGYFPKGALATKEAALLSATTAENGGKIQLKDYARQIDQIDTTIASSTTKMVEAEADYLARQASISARTFVNDSAGQLVLRAPIAGRVVQINSSVGQIASPDKALVVLAPRGESLIAELLVPSSSISAVRKGQGVRIRYRTRQRHGSISASGEVYSISGAAFAPDSAASVPADPSFRVRVLLKSDMSDAQGNRYLLRPGMTVDADLLLARKTILAWLFELTAPSTHDRIS